MIDATNGMALGGEPGGGEGSGGGSCWACGGGGGYSAVSKRTLLGNEALVVAGGGGGAGSLDGVPGTNMNGPLPGSRIDRRNGSSATVDSPGEAGDSGSIYNADWPAEPGEMWRGGKSSQFGGGGGGGYFGGGGGGMRLLYFSAALFVCLCRFCFYTFMLHILNESIHHLIPYIPLRWLSCSSLIPGTSPGVAGGGGGGSSYIHEPKAIDYVMVPGDGAKPGGLRHDPPEAVGLGEWDTKGKPVGHGGYGDLNTVTPGCAGCVRIFKPGYY